MPALFITLSILLANAEARPALFDLLGALEQAGLDCSRSSPEGYARWCEQIRYPAPSVQVSLGCDGDLVTNIELRLTPVSDQAIVHAPEEMLAVADVLSARLPQPITAWVAECVAAGGDPVAKPDRLAIDRMTLACTGSAMSPGISLHFLREDGSLYREPKKCRLPE